MSSSTVEQIKSRLSIVDVIGSYIKLEKAGINFKACCPFHNEKTPSFVVSPDRDSYHCFGCSKGGDIFSFVQDIEGVDFPSALKSLAEQAGVELTPGRVQDKSSKERLFDLLDQATNFYTSSLNSTPLVRDYLHSRGVNDSSIDRFSVGYVPDAWRAVITYLRGKGFSDEEIEKSGLAIKGELKPGQNEAPFYDRFRSRIMFPIRDTGGRVIGFSGRVYPPASSGQVVEVAKYINSPQTLLFDKSKVLYGFDLAKVSIRQKNVCVLVEGQLDVVLSHQAGITNTVAVSGTALTEEHLRSIKRLSDTLVMAFDGDVAGIRAAKRAVEMALMLDFEVKIAELPEGVDPADLVQANPEKWLEAIDQAKHVIDFYLAILARNNNDQRILGRAIREEVLPYVARLTSRLDQAHFVKKISNLLAIDDKPIWQEVDVLRSGAVYAKEDIIKTENSDKGRLDKVSEVLFGLLWWQDSGDDKDVVEELFVKMKSLLSDNFENVVSHHEKRKNQLVLATELSTGDRQDFKNLLLKAYEEFRVEFLKDQLNKTLILVKKAESAGDVEDIDRYLKKYQDISNQLRSPS